jgi:ribonucleoside-diphosphate reductase alpha chain
MLATARRYMAREPMPERRHTWRQKVRIIDAVDGASHTFYVDFGEYDDGRLGEIFITTHKSGTFVRGTLDTLAQSISLALQSGTSPLDVAKTLRDQNYPPSGRVLAVNSKVETCTSIADYIGQEIANTYGEDGRQRAADPEPIPDEPLPKVLDHRIKGSGV